LVVIPGRREAPSPESITTGGWKGVLRLHPGKQEIRDAVHWRNERPRSTRLRAQDEGRSRFHQALRCRQAGSFWDVRWPHKRDRSRERA